MGALAMMDGWVGGSGWEDGGRRMSVHDRSPEYTYAVGEAFHDCDDLFIMFIILFVLPVSRWVSYFWSTVIQWIISSTCISGGD